MLLTMRVALGAPLPLASTTRSGTRSRLDRSVQQSASARRWQLAPLTRSWVVAQTCAETTVKHGDVENGSRAPDRHPRSFAFGAVAAESGGVLSAADDRADVRAHVPGQLLGEDVVLHARRNQTDFGRGARPAGHPTSTRAVNGGTGDRTRRCESRRLQTLRATRRIRDHAGGRTYRRRQRADVTSGPIDPAGGPVPQSDTGERVTEVLDSPSRDGLSVQAIRVDYEPGGFTRGTHRHPAGAYVYVMNGSVEFAVGDGKPIVLKAGESFYEPPNALHAVSRNAREDVPASPIAFFVLGDGESAT